MCTTKPRYTYCIGAIWYVDLYTSEVCECQKPSGMVLKFKFDLIRWMTNPTLEYKVHTSPNRSLELFGSSLCFKLLNSKSGHQNELITQIFKTIRMNKTDMDVESMNTFLANVDDKTKSLLYGDFYIVLATIKITY